LDLNGRNITVVGLGVSGLAAARFLSRRGARITISDSRSEAELKTALAAISGLQPALDLGGHSDKAFANADLIVVSPGVPLKTPALARAKARGVPIIGELELAARFLRTPLAAVTGTNGKSTTVSLLGHLAREAGINVFVGGNLGTPLVEYVDGPQDADLAVAEVSSFQLEAIEEFHARWAIMLNVTPDHLDRYDGIDDYIRAKARVFDNQTAEDLAVLNFDDPLTRGMGKNLAGRVEFFSRETDSGCAAWAREGFITLAGGGRELMEFPTADLRLKGAHNLENIMAAALVARDVGIGAESLAAGLRTFHPLAHRMEFVANVNGVDFYDDSKGTNVGAVIKALEGMDRPVVLILGGRDKDSDFTLLRKAVQDKARGVALVGEAGPAIGLALGNVVPHQVANSFQEAVQLAYSMARPGDAVLLSPACASFDMFENYARRGEVFQDLVKRMEAHD